jgi:hypothetical protein
MPRADLVRDPLALVALVRRLQQGEQLPLGVLGAQRLPLARRFSAMTRLAAARMFCVER